MPCLDGGPRCDYGADHVPKLWKVRADESARLLCALVERMEDKLTCVTVEILMKDIPGLQDWWERHKADDRARLTAERDKLLAQAAEIDKRLNAPKGR